MSLQSVTLKYRRLPTSVFFNFDHAFGFLFYANSLVNPILFAMRMHEYRSALFALFRKRQVAVFPVPCNADTVTIKSYFSFDVQLCCFQTLYEPTLYTRTSTMGKQKNYRRDEKVLPATADEHAMESVFFEPPM